VDLVDDSPQAEFLRQRPRLDDQIVTVEWDFLQVSGHGLTVGLARPHRLGRTDETGRTGGRSSTHPWERGVALWLARPPPRGDHDENRVTRGKRGRAESAPR